MMQISWLKGATVMAAAILCAHANAFEYVGKYCDTPSRCIDPIATQAMVTSPNYLATQAGIKILQNGGNAIDAAIAVASTLAVVYPQMTTIGGDNFWLIHNAKTGEVRALNASGRAGEKATIDFYRAKGYKTIPSRGYLAANTVPGVVSGWDEAFRYGRKAMGGTASWPQVLESALHYAQDGFPVTPSVEKWTAANIIISDQEFRNLQRFPGFKSTYLKPDGSVYRVGEIMRQPALANTLRLIANDGAKAFYEGEIAQKIVADLEKNGGLLTLKDFKTHKANWVTPIKVPYRDTVAYNFPPNSQGMASLEILNILNNYDVKALEEGSADHYHLIVEATKEAFADRDKYLADPEFVKIPIDFLLSKEHGKDQAKRIRMDKAASTVTPLDPKGDTVWLGVVDRDGNAVSLIQSIYHDFGSGIVPDNTGVLLQNRGSFFSLDGQHVNRLEPGRRTFHTLNPAMLMKNGKPLLVYGTMGGEGQPQTQAAIVTRVIDFGMTPQDAINGPRWLHGRTWGAASNDLKIENRIPVSVSDELKRRGHVVRVMEGFTDTMGHAGAIWIDHATNLKYGAADPRGDGSAAGY